MRLTDGQAEIIRALAAGPACWSRFDRRVVRSLQRRRLLAFVGRTSHIELTEEGRQALAEQTPEKEGRYSRALMDIETADAAALARWVLDRAPAEMAVYPEQIGDGQHWCLRIPGGGTVDWLGRPWVPGRGVSARFASESDARCFADAVGLRLAGGARVAPDPIDEGVRATSPTNWTCAAGCAHPTRYDARRCPNARKALVASEED